MKVVLVVVVVLLSVVAVGQASVQTCGGTGTVDLAHLAVTGCGTPPSGRCIFTRGTNATISLPFTPASQTTKVTAKVFGKIGMVDIPFRLTNANGCRNSGLNCPLSAGTEYTYHTSIPVLTMYPDIDVTVKWELMDAANNKIVCILIPVKIQ